MRKTDANEMPQTTNDGQQVAETPVTTKSVAPAGVIRPTAKLYAFLGITVVILMATTISSVRKPQERPKAATAAVLPQAETQDTSRISDFGNVLKHQIAEQQQQQKPAEIAGTSAAQQYQNALAAQGPYGGVMQQPYAAPNQTYQNPVQDQRQALDEQEREMAFKSRFASNLVLSAGRTNASSQPTPSARAYDATAQTSGPQQTAQTAQQQRPAEVTINSAGGQPYVLYEGTILDTVLMNRLDGDQPGPVKALVTNPVYSRDRQHILIPEGSVVLGESRKIGDAGFGQQRRIALVFHRLIMPDGYSVDLDRFQGLNQIGEGGIKDKVNNHYFQIFGASIALGIISGAAELSSGNAGAFASGTDALKSGIGASVSQSATNVLDKFLNIPATITIREGHRIKVYLSQDLLLPAAENHSIPPNI